MSDHNNIYGHLAKWFPRNKRRIVGVGLKQLGSRYIGTYHYFINKI